MSIAQRLRRLEALEREHQLVEEAQRLAAEYGANVEEVLIEHTDTVERIARWGVGAEIVRLAREFGKTEDEVRAEMEAIIAEKKAP